MLSQLLKAEVAEREVHAIAYNMNGIQNVVLIGGPGTGASHAAPQKHSNHRASPPKGPRLIGQRLHVRGVRRRGFRSNSSTRISCRNRLHLLRNGSGVRPLHDLVGKSPLSQQIAHGVELWANMREKRLVACA